MTELIVFVVIALLAGAVWFYRRKRTPTKQELRNRDDLQRLAVTSDPVKRQKIKNRMKG